MKVPPILLEVCVDTVAGLHAAVANGAGRIELCAALDSGGLTPSAGFMRAASGCGVPVHAMIRPRAGGFAYSAAELAVMEQDIAAARAAGLAGVVIGAARPDGTLDGAALQRLLHAAAGLSVTLHRVFDLAPDLPVALEQSVALGIGRVLTSGGARVAQDGRVALAGLVRAARGRIVVMAGSGVSSANAAGLVRDTGVVEVHASCRKPSTADPGLAAFGFAAGAELCPQSVRELVAALRSE